MDGYLKCTWDLGTTQTTHYIYFPHIVSVEDSHAASLTEINTIIYGAENKFVMDLGTQRRITLNCTRTNPANYNDSSANPDQWSNGKWITELIKKLDFWQNRMKPNGGMTLVLTSPDEELYPSIKPEDNCNVFLSGTISPKYDVQKITFSIPLVVATMTGSKAKVDTVTLTFKSNSTPEDEFDQTYPEDTYVPVPSIPASWQGLVPSSIFDYWLSSTGASYAPGTMVKWTASQTLTARWEGPVGDVPVWGDPSESKVFFVPSEASRVVVYAIGGGGGSGGNYADIETSGGTTSWETKHDVYSGGAGGGGEFVSQSIMLMGATEITVSVGAGGASAAGNEEDGEDGQATTVIVGEFVVNAAGGAGGLGAKRSNFKVTKGGSTYYAGGNGGLKPAAGATDDSTGTPGVPGQPGEFVSIPGVKCDEQYFGGAGGGAPPLNTSFGGKTSKYISRGGNGGSGTIGGTEAESGVYGGGAGSGYLFKNTKGGDGLVALVFYR